MTDAALKTPREKPTRSAIRADIQALRAVAVLFVVFNHLWPIRLPGGYVGVDIFFVISGFLITAHLLGEVRRTNNISLPRFYARRARRLLPAALLVGAATLVATIVWIPSERWERIAREVFASAAYVQNWLLTASAVNYSDRGQAATPAQHYWSLSVEEQFYLLWPLTLLFLGWLFAHRYSGRIAARPVMLVMAISVLGLTSFVFSVWQTEAHRAAAYFNTFGRVWEFMLGGLVAAALPLLAAWFGKHPMLSLRGIAQIVGYAAILWSALRFNEGTIFPGPWAAAPVVGTALVIAAGPEMPRWTPVRLSAWRPIQYIGDISYSLYLWHWPVIVIAPFVLAREVHTMDHFAMLLLSLILASLTKHFVEDPGRARLFVRAKPRRTLLASLGSIAMIGALALGTVSWSNLNEIKTAKKIQEAEHGSCFGAAALEPDNHCDDPFGPALFPAGADEDAPWHASASECVVAPDDRQIWAEGKASYTECNFAKPSTGDPYKVWLIGDSHSEHWQAAMFNIARSNGWELKTTMQGGCPSVPLPLINAFGAPVAPAKKDACLSWISEVSKRILDDRPDLVIVSNFASTEEASDGSGRTLPAMLAAGMQESFVKWADAGARVVDIRDVPSAGTALGADCVAQRGQIASACTAPESEVLPDDPMVQAVKLLADPRISSVDLTEYFCRDKICSGVIGSLPVYFDYDHLSASYSKTLAPMLARKLSQTIGRDLEPPVNSTI